MPSSKAADPDATSAEAGEPVSAEGPIASAPWVDPHASERTLEGARMPYSPSVPCASCAKGVDPLRAACISMTELSVHYFCTRHCRESYVRSEAEHHEKVARAPEPRVSTALPAAKRSASFEPVARRVAPTDPNTPPWPLPASACLLMLGLLANLSPVPGLDRLAAFGLTAVAALFTSRAVLTRVRGSLFGWLSAPVGVALFALASVLAGDTRALLGQRAAHVYLLGATVGVVLIWLREHWLERGRATHEARRTELSARMSPRVRLSSLPPASSSSARQSSTPSSPFGSTPRPEHSLTSDRALEQVRVGDELVLDAGSVMPVDGVVVSGFGEVLPYPRALLTVPRARGQSVLAGALLTHGTLRLRTTQVGDQRALFRAFADRLEERASSQAERFAEAAERMDHGLKLALAAVVLCLLAPSGVSSKLAGLAAALLSFPAVALARGVRGALQRAVVAASARGVLYRGPLCLERAGAMDTAVLRVEGPLVSRSYTLIEICSLSDTHDARALLELALGAELADETHGIARAVHEHAATLDVVPVALKRLVHARGRGITGLTDGQGTLVFGSRAALLSAGVSVAVADREAQRAERLGQRVVFLALGGRARGLFVFAQTVQPEARVALQTLFDLGLEVELVSGDHRPTVEAIARTLDITQVKAELSSEQRATEVRRLRDGEARVVAIGHIPEDQALLAAAELSLSLDAAAEANEHDVLYDITTASPDLRDAAAALSLARRARGDVRQTLIVSGVGAGVALLTAVGAVPPLVCLCAAVTVDWLCLAWPLGGSESPTRPLARGEDRALRGK